MTQSGVADTLNVSRIMINRLLSEARSRGEVSIKVTSRWCRLLNCNVILNANTA